MKTRKILIDTCHGGFGLNAKALEVYLTKSKIPYEKEKRKPDLFDEVRYALKVEKGYFSVYDLPRDDKLLIEAVEEVGLKESADWCAELKIVEIPDDVDWVLMEYDGLEWIAEKHRTWH